MTEEMRVPGHKVFVYQRGGSPVIEMVNDDRPLVRMALPLTAEDAREIAQWLVAAADAADS